MSPITAGPPDPAQPRSCTHARAALDRAQRRMERAWHEYASADPARTTTGYQQQLYDAYLDALDAWIWAVRADQRQIEQRGGAVMTMPTMIDRDDAPVDDDPFCATCGCLPDEPEERDDGDGLWRLVRPCACDCHAASEGMEWD